jgi:hypothetical protein
MSNFKLSDQSWAYVFVVSGCVMAIVCHKFQIAADIGSMIIGAGVNAFNKAETKQTMNVDHIGTVTQTNDAPPPGAKV